MLYDMKLYKKPFDQIKQGIKTVELRLFDEKRQQIKPMDEIRFTQTETGEVLQVKVYALHIYADFEQLYKHFDKTQLGYANDEEYDYKDMYAYYSLEDIQKYGVLAIELI